MWSLLQNKIAVCGCTQPRRVPGPGLQYWLLVCRHVINNADDVTVTLLDQSVYNAKVRCQPVAVCPAVPDGIGHILPFLDVSIL